jgi:DNA (cytosine-5)-methyltransferase 1
VSTFGSLFSGIDGIGLGLERAGWTPRWQVEIEPFPSRILGVRWPDVPRYGDIRAIDWSLVEPVDLIAGGFPCQPSSVAGKRRYQADERWLWPEFARAIRALRPRLVLVENVAGLLAARGGFGDVLRDLAEAGYDSRWDSLRASDVGAPHKRERVFLVAREVAYPDSGYRTPGGLHLRRDRPDADTAALSGGAGEILAHSDDSGCGEPGGGASQMRRNTPPLNAAVLFPTPKASDGDRGGRGDLTQVAKGHTSASGRWPTPRASGAMAEPIENLQERGGASKGRLEQAVAFGGPRKRAKGNGGGNQ